MKRIKVNIKIIIFIFFMTVTWFSIFTGKSQINCSGDYAGEAYGVFFLWHMKSLVTSLAKVVDLKLLVMDFIVCYLTTFTFFFLIVIIGNLRTSILENRYWLITSFLISIVVLGFFLVEFLFQIDIQTIDCHRIKGTYTFGLRL